MNQKTEKILFIVNPVSGGKEKELFYRKIKELEKKYNYTYQVFETTGKNDTQKIKEKLSAFAPDKAIAVGGDGTCNMLASVLMKTSVVMGIIPFGSANGLATEFKIPGNIEQAVKIISTGVKQEIDIVTINNRHISLHISDIGFNAKIVKRYEQRSVRGMWGYARQFGRELFMSKPHKYVFETGKGSFKRKAHMVAIANSREYGTGAIINPLGKINDGKFEICIFKPYPFWAIFRFIYAFFAGTLHRLRYVEILSFKEIKIRNRDRETLQIDGEPIGEIDTINVGIKPDTLTVVIPAKGEEKQTFD